MKISGWFARKYVGPFVFFVSLAVVMLGGACRLLLLEEHSQRTQRALLQERVNELRLEPSFPKMVTTGSFVGRLTREHEIDSFMKFLRRACEFNAVNIQLIALADTSATPAMLSRQRLSIGLSGSYGGIKQVLADISERYSDGLLLQGISIRRSASGAATVDANVELALLGLPGGRLQLP